MLCVGWMCFGMVVNAQSYPFQEISAEVGIQHVFRVDKATFGGGVAVLDIDNDGFEDLYVTGGRSGDALYKNDGSGGFRNILESAGFDSLKGIYTQGVSAADVNRDGFKDILVTTFYELQSGIPAANRLFLNNGGDGTFTDVTEAWGLGELRNHSQGATFGDINADGYIDLFIANYYSSAPRGFREYNEATITSSFTSADDYLLLNSNGQRFLLVNDLYGMDYSGFGFQGVFSDFDIDGDLDLYIANDFGFKKTPNVLLRNDFPQRKMPNQANNLALNYGMNAMGIAPGDYNFDGLMDYLVTNISASLFVSKPNKEEDFINLAPELGLAIPTIFREDYAGPPISWGANFFDYDHDQDLDLFIANGALNPTIRENFNFFFQNDNGIFNEISRSIQMDDSRIARGSAVFDYDNDGDLDLFVVNQAPRDPTDVLPKAQCLFYKNEGAAGNWLKISLRGKKSDTFGIGSRVEAYINGKILLREIDGGSGHLSQNSTIAHFGLGPEAGVDSVVVRWIGGGVQKLLNVAANQHLVIEEDLGTASAGQPVLLEVFPSPFKDQLNIQFDIRQAGPVRLDMYDALGRHLTQLADIPNSTGAGFVNWTAREDWPKGVYFLVLRTSQQVISYKLIKTDP